MAKLSSDQVDNFKIQANQIIRLTSHFIHTTGDWSTGSAGTSSIASVLSTYSANENKPGLGALRSGSAPAGQARFGTPNGGTFRGMLLGFQDWIYENVARTLVLSNSTNTFVWMDGFVDAANTLAGNGVYFRYSHTLSPRFECVCSTNGTATIVDTGVTVVPNTWYKKTIIITKTGIATFFINDVLVATIDTNLPTIGVSPNLCLFNTVGTGLTRGIDVDYFEVVGRY